MADATASEVLAVSANLSGMRIWGEGDSGEGAECRSDRLMRMERGDLTGANGDMR